MQEEVTDLPPSPLAAPPALSAAPPSSFPVDLAGRPDGRTGPAGKPVSVADEALVRRLRAGDTAAAEGLVRRYHQPLLRYLHRLSGSEQVAEDLHQQTWLSVLEHLDKFDPSAGPGSFKAWLFRIATNKFNDHWRSNGRDRSAREGLRLVAEREYPEAGHRLHATEQEDRLRRAIEQLPEAQRQVLLLRYYANLKFVDIAAMLGCPLNTALGRMHKAMLKLKDIFGGDRSEQRGR